MMTSIEYRSAYELTKDTPYLALTGKLWSFLYEYFEEKLLCYKEFGEYFNRSFILPCVAL